MAQEPNKPAASGGNKRNDSKEARLAEALRANLRRRKAQSAARKYLSESDSGPDGAVSLTEGQIKRNETE